MVETIEAQDDATPEIIESNLADEVERVLSSVEAELEATNIEANGSDQSQSHTEIRSVEEGKKLTKNQSLARKLFIFFN